VLLTIAGSSCSGKTTALQACAAILGLVVHDFDEIGVPSDVDTVRRLCSLEEWVQRVLRYQAGGLDVVPARRRRPGALTAARGPGAI
jgi:hypothetical protein